MDLQVEESNLTVVVRDQPDEKINANLAKNNNDVQQQQQQQQHWSRTNDKYVRMHTEKMNRFVSPITLAVVKIPGSNWPRLILGECSTGASSNVFLREPILTGLTAEAIANDDTQDKFRFRFLRDWWHEVKSDDLTTTKRDRDERVSYREIRHRMTAYTNGRIDKPIEEENINGGSLASIETLNEYVDSCFPALELLGTTRTTMFDRLDGHARRFSRLTKLLTTTVVDMEQCKNLLRQTIRELYVSETTTPLVSDSTALTIVGKETCLRNAINHKIETTIKECVAFLSSLQTRKCATVVRIARLKRRIERIEQNREPTNETVVANDVYRAVVQNLTDERANAIHVGRQIDTMRDLVDQTRKLLIDAYTDLYNEWSLHSETNGKLINALRSYQVTVHPTVRNTIERDIYSLDFFRTLEVLRHANMLTMKHVEDAYDTAYEEMIPNAQRSSRATVQREECANDGRPPTVLPFYDQQQRRTNATATTSTETTTRESNTIDGVFRAVSDLNRAIETTRDNYRRGLWERAPADVRRLSLSFTRLVERRLTHLKLHRTNARALTEDKTSSSLPLDLDEMEHATVNRFVATTMNRYEQEYLTSQITNANTIDGESIWFCRPIGDTIVTLRDTQDCFDVACLLRSLEKHFNDELAARLITENAHQVNRDTVCSNWNERRVIDELERATENTFGENVGSWNKLIGRIKTIERESIGDSADTANCSSCAQSYPCSARIENWYLRPYDTFHLTIVHSRFTQIDTLGELGSVQRQIADYAYLLSWLLQMKTYVGREELVSSDEDGTEDVEENVAGRAEKEPSRTRNNNDRRRPPPLRNNKRRKSGDRDEAAREAKRSKTDHRTNDKNDSSPQSPPQATTEPSPSPDFWRRRDNRKRTNDERANDERTNVDDEDEQKKRRKTATEGEEESTKYTEQERTYLRRRRTERERDKERLRNRRREDRKRTRDENGVEDEEDEEAATVGKVARLENVDEQELATGRKRELTEAERTFARRRREERDRDADRLRTSRRFDRKRTASNEPDNTNDDDNDEDEDDQRPRRKLARRNDENDGDPDDQDVLDDRDYRDDLDDRDDQDDLDDRDDLDDSAPSTNRSSDDDETRNRNTRLRRRRRRRGTTARLRHLLRMAENSPGDINLLALNQMFRDETERRRELQRDIRSNLREIENLYDIGNTRSQTRQGNNEPSSTSDSSL